MTPPLPEQAASGSQMAMSVVSARAAAGFLGTGAWAAEGRDAGPGWLCVTWSRGD